MSYGNVIFNNGSGYSSITNSFTSPVNGVYLFAASIGVDQNPGGLSMLINIKKNGVIVGSNVGLSSPAFRSYITLTTIISLLAGDIVNIEFIGSASAILPSGVNVFFSGTILF
ncbi:hypothetical protein PDM82_25660 [Bacillus cereus]|nr:hypothetical protein [Bacillus cereus]